jgi:hypothetical protein
MPDDLTPTPATDRWRKALDAAAEEAQRYVAFRRDLETLRARVAGPGRRVPSNDARCLPPRNTRGRRPPARSAQAGRRGAGK